jgi:hypothetical protein
MVVSGPAGERPAQDDLAGGLALPWRRGLRMRRLRRATATSA